MIAELIATLKHARASVSFEDIGQLQALKEEIVRLETELAHGKQHYELTDAGLSRRAAKLLERRASYYWADSVPVETQDLILNALEKLSGCSKRRQEIYDLAATTAHRSSPEATFAYTKRLVREENERLTGDVTAAHRARRFTIRRPDARGGCSFYGYAPAATAALMASLLDQAFRADFPKQEDPRTITQRNFDAFEHMVRWASSNRRAATGHCSLVVSVTDGDGFDWRGKFATNVGIDLNLFDIDYLGSDRVTDYIVVHDHKGAVKHLVTGQRCANWSQRISLMARDLVCQHPGCDVPASRCDAHHVRAWSRGGWTDIANLGLLCRRHHRRNDDSGIRRHLQLREGIPWWVDDAGYARRNRSPAAHRAGSNRVMTNREPGAPPTS
ncbi:HNH endonuclease signature motif containing protein [Corynebacterium sp. H128]|uniref:HNH endonuclease signature motif containing protein n=1 Tax=Corynebacterium sp. H128 TaxID=3133427 RepID=UPI0030ACDF7B